MLKKLWNALMGIFCLLFSVLFIDLAKFLRKEHHFYTNTLAINLTRQKVAIKSSDPK